MTWFNLHVYDRFVPSESFAPLLVHSQSTPLCPACGSKMILRSRRDGTGQFWGCSKFPRCKGTLAYSPNQPSVPQQPQTQPVSPPVATQQPNSPRCPQCGSDMILRTRRDNSGRQFWGCSNFPRCKGIVPYSKDKVDQSTSTPQAQNQPQNWYNKNVALVWTLVENLQNNTPAVIAKDGNGFSWIDENWQAGTEYNSIDQTGAAQMFKSVVGPEGKYTSQNPQDLFDIYYKLKNEESGASNEAVPGEITPQKAPWVPLKPEELAGREKGIISAENITQEQHAIAQSFGQGNNIATAALAGTGKTTAIFHLACAYGRQGEDWQYLVFNTKNKVEAKLKAKQYGIDSFFSADSTNGYLGKVIEDRMNAGKIPPTKRMVSIDKKVPQKIGQLLDGPDMVNLMKTFDLPNPELVDRSRFSKYGKSAMIVGNVTLGVLRQIKYEFKQACKKMTGLGKAYALDPRKGQQQLSEGLLKIAKDHDVDFGLSKIKERVSKYPPDLRSKVQEQLNSILGYDIMDKNIQNEVLKSTEFLLNASLPRNTNQEYVHKYSNGRKQTFNLGEMRDFDDDLWFAAINADNLKWPKKKVVMADEAQDFNACQIIALKKLAEAGAQVVIVGDKNQAMYRFRGASDTAIEDMRKILKIKEPNTLSKNFRCRPAIIDFSNQNTHVKNLVRGKRISDQDVAEFLKKAKNTPENMEYLAEMQKKYPGTENGLNLKAWRSACNEGTEEWPPSAYGIVTKNELDYNAMILSIMKEKQASNGKLRATAILSPTNAELLPAALELLGYGVPFVITGSDLSKELVEHSEGLMFDWEKIPGRPWKRINWPSDTPITKLLDKLHQHNDKEQGMHGHKAAKEDELKTLNLLTTALDKCIHMYDSGASNAGMPDDFDPNDADAMEALRIQQGKMALPNAGENGGGTTGGFLSWLRNKLGGLDIDTNETDAMEYMKATEDENNAPVTLSTVHRAKGLEFPVVHILNYDGLVNPKNVTREEDLQQWKNAHYVALTRAKDAQHIIAKDED